MSTDNTDNITDDKGAVMNEHDVVAHDRAEPGEQSRLSRRELLARAGQLGAVAASAGAVGKLAGLRPGSLRTLRPSVLRRGAAGSPVRGGTLSAALTGDPSSLDPALADVYTGDEVYDNIYSKLLQMQPDGTFGPELATSWTQPSPTSWEFDLVGNAVFHNGEAFSAADVKYTFDRILAKATGSPYVTNYDVIDGIEVVSPTKVIFHLKTPYGPFLTNLCGNAQIVNQKAIETMDPKVHPIGTGPFQFVSWVQNEKITVQSFDKYFRSGQPYREPHPGPRVGDP
jgi:peptide/nickel transport system substrate-binding protein